MQNIHTVRWLTLGLVLFTAVGTTGCQSLLINKSPPKAEVIVSNHTAADVLIQQAGPNLAHNSTLLVASFVNVDDLTLSSTFGRLAAEQVAGQFTACGYQIVEAALRNSLYIRERQGQFLLSRELRELSSDFNAPTVIVGTYAVGRERIYVNARLVRAADNVVVAAYNYELPIDRDVSQMLRDNR
ncbi:MAG: FlgO family outer membrane protein [Pseudomonadota bacterium]